MSNDLQATQQIINLFENSKEQTEAALRSLPGIYAVIDSDGNILKGNEVLAELFAVGFEDLLGRHLGELFNGDGWERFKAEYMRLDRADCVSVNCQIDVHALSGGRKIYTWSIYEIELQQPAPRLFSILGRDVSDLMRATEENTRMQMELTTAKTVQDTLFPTSDLVSDHCTIAGSYEPASECGGDWWHYTHIGNRVMLWIGDVTGHGVASALVTSAVCAAVSIIEKQMPSPSEALQILNRVVWATSKGQKFMTFLIATIDLETRECCWSSAAHEDAIVVPAGDGELTVKQLSFLMTDASHPLGAEGHPEYCEHRIQLQSGSSVIFYTDGVQDVVNSGQEFLGKRKFRKLVAANSPKSASARELVDSLKGGLKSFQGTGNLIDDVTFFVIRFA